MSTTVVHVGDVAVKIPIVRSDRWGDEPRRGDSGVSLWPCSIALARYLVHYGPYPDVAKRKRQSTSRDDHHNRTGKEECEQRETVDMFLWAIGTPTHMAVRSSSRFVNGENSSYHQHHVHDGELLLMLCEFSMNFSYLNVRFT